MSPWLCLPLSGNSTSPDACREQVQAVLPLLLRYSPQLAQPQPGVLLQNLRASLMLFGGLCTLYARIRQDLQPLLPGLRPALASTARGAWMLALAPGRQRRCLRRLQPRLDALPVDLLDPSPDELRWLHSLGCRRLGQLRQLPRDGLAQRGLRDLLLRLDQAYGERELVLDWQVAAVTAEYEQLRRRLPSTGAPDDPVARIRWMIEELRVSLFAQSVGTPRPVSEQRVYKAIDAL